MSDADLHHTAAFGEDAARLAEEIARDFPPPPTPSEEPVTVRVLAGEALADETWSAERARAEAQAVIEGEATAYYSAEAFAHVYMPPEPPSVALIAATDAERDRRLPLGVAYQGRLYQTRPFDIDNLTGAATGAVAALVQGAQPGDLRWADPDADFAWIDAGNDTVPMDAPTMIGLARAAMNRRAALIHAAREIKTAITGGATPDIASDDLWPA